MRALAFCRLPSLLVTICLGTGSLAYGQGDDRLIGVWSFNDGFQVTEYLFRSDGRYQLDVRSVDPTFDFSSTERGLYETSGQSLTLIPYEYLNTPDPKEFTFEIAGTSLALTRLDISQTDFYGFVPGSRQDVLTKESVPHSLIKTWTRNITFYGKEEYTFRTAGYYFVKSIPDESEFPPEFSRGRYEVTNNIIKFTPYSGTPLHYELDFFGNTLTIISTNFSSGDSKTYTEVPGSAAEVAAKCAEADAFMSRSNWLTGIWKIRDGVNLVDLTFRPDGYYISTNATELLRGIVRGKYTLDQKTIRFFPFMGQGLYSRDNGDFGKVERTRELDYYDGELQIIDLDAISQWVSIATNLPGSEASVLQKTEQAQQTRQIAGWQIGSWEVNDPNGWMEFTFRPDGRYIGMSGSGGVPGQVERGHYVITAAKATLAPYSGQNSPRGFEIDLYDGNLFLIGDLTRMVVSRKIPGSETTVIQKTTNPISMQGEKGPILGLWTANLPGQYVELVLRDDGQFRLKGCLNNALSFDYGLYSANAPARTMIYDSRFVAVQNKGLDFYGDTLTIYGGMGVPNTYTVNLGTVDASIEASFQADAADAVIDSQWLTRIPISPRDPTAVHTPGGGIPADPNPTHVFNSPTVFSGYQLYRRLIPGLVYFYDQGTVKTVPVVNTREWHFLKTGRVLVRFRNHSAGVYPNTIETVTDDWGAYRVDPKPTQQDILHIYADNSVLIESDAGELTEMTLEDGRRHLFWEKDYMLQWEWASEQQPVPCELPTTPDPRLINTGLSLSTVISPDPIESGQPVAIKLSATSPGTLAISGVSDLARTFVVERASSLSSPVNWQGVQTNTVSSGAFNLTIPQGTNATGYFRLRVQ